MLNVSSSAIENHTQNHRGVIQAGSAAAEDVFVSLYC
jgi:hypothetical protein